MPHWVNKLAIGNWFTNKPWSSGSCPPPKCLVPPLSFRLHTQSPFGNPARALYWRLGPNGFCFGFHSVNTIFGYCWTTIARQKIDFEWWIAARRQGKFEKLSRTNSVFYNARGKPFPPNIVHRSNRSRLMRNRKKKKHSREPASSYTPTRPGRLPSVWQHIRLSSCERDNSSETLTRTVFWPAVRRAEGTLHVHLHVALNVFRYNWQPSRGFVVQNSVPVWTPTGSYGPAKTDDLLRRAGHVNTVRCGHRTSIPSRKLLRDGGKIGIECTELET